MQIMKYKSEIETYLNKLKTTIDALPVESIDTLMSVLVKASTEHRTVFVMGNGGSAATASHFVCDFNKAVSIHKLNKFKMICLNDNVPIMMAYANDMNFEEIFIHQLKNFFSPGDVVVGISGSGNSMNIIKAIEYANENGGTTIGLTGFNGGKLKKIVHYNVNVPIDDMQIVEDLHLALNHCMTQILRNLKDE